MKSILVPIDQSDTTQSVLQCAKLLAERFGATIEGAALRPIFTEIVAPDPIVAVTIPPVDWDEGAFAGKTKAVFEAFAAANGGSGAKFAWRNSRALEDASLGSIGRVYDITVVGRPTSRGVGARMSTLESALFESGRPVLIAPPTAPSTLGDTAVIHWNCSTETARVTSLALPLLQQAKKVLVLTVEGSTVDGPPASEALRWLAAHGITATEKTVPADGRNPGAVILAEAAAYGADLLVKGAYTQSRLRQMIFGGATQHILSSTEIPVFMEH